VIVVGRAPPVKPRAATSAATVVRFVRPRDAPEPVQGGVECADMTPAKPHAGQTRDFIIMQLMRYELQLVMLERRSDLDDEAAIGLLRAELALAQHAGYFDDLSAEDFEVGTITRSAPPHDVTRYRVDLLLEERIGDIDDDRAQSLVRRAFADAVKASYFLKVASDDQIAVTLVSREPSPVSSPA
jgi:hypothetical protein